MTKAIPASLNFCRKTYEKGQNTPSLTNKKVLRKAHQTDNLAKLRLENRLRKQIVLSHSVRYTTTLRVYLFATNALRLCLSLRSTLRQRRKCAHVQLHATLRVMFARYVHCARFPQMLRACVSLCLWSAPKGGSTRKACWLFFEENSLNPPDT